MSRLTVILLAVWPSLLVFWLVMMLIPDRNWLMIGFGLFTSATGLVVALGRRKYELQRDHNPSFPVLDQDYEF